MNKKSKAIFAALSHELASIKHEMSIDSKLREHRTTIISGKYNFKSIIVVQSGVGKDAMKEAVQIAKKHYQFPEAINIGYCAGARPDLALGDLVIIKEAVEQSEGSVFESDESLYMRAEKICKQNSLRFKIGRSITCDKQILLPHDKAFIGTQFRVDAIDMESSSFLKETKKLGVPSLVVRSVLDPMDFELPDLNGVDENGNTDLISISGKLAKNPKNILKMPRLQYLATKSQERISSFAKGWCINVS